MKKLNFSLTILLTLLMSQALFAQTNVKFEIKHLLGQDVFAFNTLAQNSMMQDFQVTRLEYYISGIAITHDTGKVTTIVDNWILVNAGDQTLVDLGNHAIQQVEAISFYVGIDPDYNHVDPALYPITHPLGPKAPSMHWGWAAGYRFLAMEGTAGANSSLFQLHGLGDKNYFQASVVAPMTTHAANEVVISISADYTRALESIDVSAGVIVHGDYGAAQQALSNFQGFVFSPAVNNTAIEDELTAPLFTLYPNPASSGKITLTAEAALSSYDVIVSDLVGRKVSEEKIPAGQSTLTFSLEATGMYLVTLIRDGQAMATKKLVVK